MSGLWRPAYIYPRWDGAERDFEAAADAYVREVIEFYDARARWHRRLYRLTGMTVIIAGVALPLLTASDLPGRSTAIAVTGCVVAALTALRAFYRWDSSWVLMRRTEMEVSQSYIAWKAKQAVATDPAARTEAAREMVDLIYSVRRSESAEYFKGLTDPSLPAQHDGKETRARA